MARLFAAMTASSALVLTTAMPVGAAPRGREDQWWFSAWAVEKKVWSVSTGKGVTVALVDNGVNGRILDLQGVVVPGTDALTGSGDGQIGPTSDVDASHGTGMAGLIAAQGTGTGYVGVAPDAKIMSVKSNLTVWDKAIRYAADHGAEVISISQAFAAVRGCRPEVQQAISYALQRDVVVVAGAGNNGAGDNESMEPANCAGALAVGAVNLQRTPWAGSERQPYVAVAAPGYAVNTLNADGRVATNRVGTSQATALTSAVAALIRSRFPRMSAREVVQRIINTTEDAGPPGKDDRTGYGVVIPRAALTADVPKSAPNPVFAAYDEWVKTNGLPAAVTPGKWSGKRADDSDDQAARNTWVLIGGVVVAGMLGVGFVVFVVVRGRRRAGRVASAGGPQQGGPPFVPPDGSGGSRPPQ
ncbi:S8 family serine peptidase [Actinomadura chibensis]|uniref:S8 family serine peptidase n=1 Tax=Actinomadura chibensis TaxID=392828 RepID=A0A5D0N9B0_9ACTN|nr:S8 family serine peptidase [Actinomadura chibensis]TYB40887.1 S8 family serine peptidase [Actinomadura chibensis]